MQIKVLSVRNPISYLLCIGQKDIENRTWTTPYRGRLYIHSSGPKDIFGVPDFRADFDYTCMAQFNDCMDHLAGVLDYEKSEFLDRNKKTGGTCPTKRANLAEYERYKILNDMMNRKEDLKQPFWRKAAIIGHVDLVDIVTDADSEHAYEDNNHWIIKNPVLFNKPVLHVKGKLNLWDYDLQHKYEELEPVKFY